MLHIRRWCVEVLCIGVLGCLGEGLLCVSLHRDIGVCALGCMGEGIDLPGV